MIGSRRSASKRTAGFNSRVLQVDGPGLAPRGAPGRPVILFVLGFGRSGTSALTRVLSLSGAALPSGLLGATRENRRGYWEPRRAIHLNQEILRGHGSSGYDMSLRAQEEGAFDVESNTAYVDKIRAYLTTLPTAPLVIIKEPKMTMMPGLWFEAASQAGFDIAAVISVRHPQEIIGSLAKRADYQHYVRDSPELTMAWWLKYSLLAERNTRDVPRVFVEYANLLEDWRQEVKRVSVALGVDLSTQDEGAIERFLSPDLQHHRHFGAVEEPFGGDWVAAVYDAMRCAAGDEPLDRSELDRVYEAYRLSERGFRAAFENDRRFGTLSRLMSPFLVKLGLEALALLHRRRGTWA
ncbi:conserved hypothetical protein [uncultured Mycobacterium sp.]|uniref:Sulfotransferase family protein n=1 Tax=uncultured Mycobacterium sp. TaxID=171292 RepID=A0A1Y5PA34_9MYCO|nr:conserved hypothetical protein [uncultured Mycobacterium sp.]SBS75717.1 conserved hypothetical protein [uncultured Mycobacterium sp.]